MTQFVPVTANADYELASLVGGDVVTVSWAGLNGATVQLLSRHQANDGVKSATIPVADGTFSDATTDSLDNPLKSLNVFVGGGTLIARVTGYVSTFDLLVD